MHAIIIALPPEPWNASNNEDPKPRCRIPLGTVKPQCIVNNGDGDTGDHSIDGFFPFCLPLLGIICDTNFCSGDGGPFSMGSRGRKYTAKHGKWNER